METEQNSRGRNELGKNLGETELIESLSLTLSVVMGGEIFSQDCNKKYHRSLECYICCLDKSSLKEW